MTTDLRDVLLDASPDAVIATTVEGNVLFWSKGAEATFGYTSAETLGRRVHELIVPAECLAEERRVLDEALKSGFAACESMRSRKDGSRVYVDTSYKIVRDERRGIEFVLRGEKDVTQLRVNREAKVIRTRFRDLLESMPNPIVLANLAGRLVFANSQAKNLFGYAPGELQGKPVELLLAVHCRNDGLFSDLRTRSLEPGMALDGRRSDGSEFPMEVSVSLLETEEGTLVSAAIRDITERKRFEQALHEKNVELEAANKELEAFDYSVAHDLRAPLDRIAGFSTVLGEQYGDKLDERGRDLLLRILAAGRSMEQLVDDLLHLSTVARGKLARTAVDVSSLAEAIVAALRKSDPQRELHFIVPPDMSARADPGLLRAVLENLLGNAWKFTRGRSPARIELGCVDQPAERVFFVRDNGAGFDNAGAEELFKPFRRLHAASDYEGTGIGLATVQRIVRRHGGRVWAEASAGHGATFFFTLSAPTDRAYPADLDRTDPG